MRVKASPDPARRHVSTRCPDINGTFPCNLSLLGHRVCCREQHGGTDYKNNLLHRLFSGCLTTACNSQGQRVSPWHVGWTAIIWSANPAATSAAQKDDRALQTCIDLRQRA